MSNASNRRASLIGRRDQLGLLEAIIDRTADVLERVVAETDSLSHEVFKKGNTKQEEARP